MSLHLFNHCVCVLVLVASCKPPPDPGMETSMTTSGTESQGGTASSTSPSSGLTTEAAGPCGADGVQFGEICFRRYDIPSCWWARSQLAT